MAAKTPTFYSKNYYSAEKWLGLMSFLPVLCSTITVVTVNDQSLLEPWTNNLIKINRTPLALFSSCHAFDINVDQNYPLLLQRCILSDIICSLAISLCVIWFILVCFAFLAPAYIGNDEELNQKISTLAALDQHRSAMKMILHCGIGGSEPNWGRYMPDPPSTVYSTVTLNSRTGLLTPISNLTKEKHLEFYAKNGKYYYTESDNKFNTGLSSYNYDDKIGDYNYYCDSNSFNNEKKTSKDYYTNSANWAKDRTSVLSAPAYRTPSPLQKADNIEEDNSKTSSLHQHYPVDYIEKKAPHTISKEQLLHSSDIDSNSEDGKSDEEDKNGIVEGLTVSNKTSATYAEKTTSTPLYSKFSAKSFQDFKLL
ncbi:hypothetical protein BDF20DRAFT_386047 [Mycotypha africana]|uniref:uncharacterized protein n=1 Tax=Mycotypha africana TaxID=64632 RepID=UPI0023011EBD|nr:uncharacterized protein BDF20DRAFT_386047 [Mycotypha africana]KAI8984380.1 hypothetical protein BDF20DRAFT_386047 [Mycotypha africana]